MIQETYDLISQATKKTGLTTRQYREKYGRSKAVASSVLASGPDNLPEALTKQPPASQTIRSVSDLSPKDQERLEDLEWMAATGTSFYEASERLEVSEVTITRLLISLGRQDILTKLRGRELGELPTGRLI